MPAGANCHAEVDGQRKEQASPEAAVGQLQASAPPSCPWGRMQAFSAAMGWLLGTQRLRTHLKTLFWGTLNFSIIPFENMPMPVAML